MKTLFLSDTHTFHRELIIAKDIDMIIHTGDVSNVHNPAVNANEVLDFIDWYESVPVKYKLWTAGNHDGSIERRLVRPKDIQNTTTYLEHEYVVIEGLKIFLSPYSPTFGDWYFMKRRDKMYQYWEHIPEDTDILGTHTPPKAILDISEDKNRVISYCGDSALRKRVEKVNPKFHCFGHIHNYQDHVNHGIRKIGGCDTIFVNASLVEDGKFSKGLIHQGITIEL